MHTSPHPSRSAPASGTASAAPAEDSPASWPQPTREFAGLHIESIVDAQVGKDHPHAVGLTLRSPYNRQRTLVFVDARAVAQAVAIHHPSHPVGQALRQAVLQAGQSPDVTGRRSRRVYYWPDTDAPKPGPMDAHLHVRCQEKLAEIELARQGCGIDSAEYRETCEWHWRTLKGFAPQILAAALAYADMVRPLGVDVLAKPPQAGEAPGSDRENGLGADAVGGDAGA